MLSFFAFDMKHEERPCDCLEVSSLSLNFMSLGLKEGEATLSFPVRDSRFFELGFARGKIESYKNGREEKRRRTI